MPQRDIVIDVSNSAYESGFKFNTIPFGGMTIDTKNSVRIGSATDIKLAPPSGYTIIIGTTGAAPPTAAAAYRGALFFFQAGAGAGDQLQMCVKGTGGGYSWQPIFTAP